MALKEVPQRPSARELAAASAKAASKASALIIAGGRGTRFWPASRENRPKPLFSIDEGTTLLSETIARLQLLIARERIFVLVTAAQRKAFASAIADLIPAGNLILEPDGRGTTVAIAYGAAVIRKRFGDGLIAVMPADHYITPASSFRNTLAKAIGLASSEKRDRRYRCDPDASRYRLRLPGNRRAHRRRRLPGQTLRREARSGGGEKDGGREALPLERGNVRDDDGYAGE